MDSDKEEPEFDKNEDQGQDTPSAPMESLLSRISQAQSLSSIDQAAIDFTLISSTRNSRKRLVKTLASVPRSRTDLLPYHARLTATLSREMFPDVGISLVDQLERDFHHHVKKGKTDQQGFMMEEKIKNIRFIGELVKFRVTPTHIAFHCLKVCISAL